MPWSTASSVDTTTTSRPRRNENIRYTPGVSTACNCPFMNTNARSISRTPGNHQYTA